MKEFLDIWDLIVKSNTFNFVLLVAIFCFIFKKIDISKILDKLQTDIVNTIENVKNNKNLAGIKLSKAKDSIKNLDKDIELQMEQANITAKSITDNIFQAAEKNIELINKNIDKVIATEEKTISSSLTEKTAEAAILIAENHIVTTLRNRPELHNKYIEESIQELDRIELI